MRLLAAVMSAALLAGCVGGQPAVSDSAGGPVRVRVSGVPFHPQDGFRCGPSAMAMMLGWSGLPVEPALLESQFYGPLMEPERILRDAALRFGRLPYPISGTEAMMRELAAGHPVLVLQNLGVASEPLWNCAVAIGFDRAAGEILMQGGDQPNKRMSVRLFERLWSDTDQWGLVVLPAGDLPATVAKDAYLTAAKALEKSGRHWEAVMAFDAALSKWASEPDALMGLATSLQLLGDPLGAADAYRAAAKAAPDPAPALAALKDLMAELGVPGTQKASATKEVREPD